MGYRFILNKLAQLCGFYLETPLLVPSMLCSWLVMERKYYN